MYGQDKKAEEEKKLNKLKLLTMSDIPVEEVRWLWYPYLPRGKITIIQGDPGEGKSNYQRYRSIWGSDLL